MSWMDTFLHGASLLFREICNLKAMFSQTNISIYFARPLIVIYMYPTFDSIDLRLFAFVINFMSN
jgi:ABC-type uncharacterized transport system permease subunit